MGGEPSSGATVSRGEARWTGPSSRWTGASPRCAAASAPASAPTAAPSAATCRACHPSPVAYDGHRPRLLRRGRCVAGRRALADRPRRRRPAAPVRRRAPSSRARRGSRSPHSLESIGAMWAAPVLDARAAHVLASDLQEGTWRLRVYPLNAAIIGGAARGRGFALASEPDTSAVVLLLRAGPAGGGRRGSGTARRPRRPPGRCPTSTRRHRPGGTTAGAGCTCPRPRPS